MPPLDNKAHEKFCHFVARGNDPVVAYVGAGYPRIPEAAARFLCQQRIIDRIQEILPFYLERFPDDDGPKNVPTLIENVVNARKAITRLYTK